MTVPVWTVVLGVTDGVLLLTSTNGKYFYSIKDNRMHDIRKNGNQTNSRVICVWNLLLLSDLCSGSTSHEYRL